MSSVFPLIILVIMSVILTSLYFYIRSISKLSMTTMTNLIALQSKIDAMNIAPGSIMDTGVPLGTVLAYSSSVLPTNGKYMFCDGSEVSIASYPDLFKVLGNMFNKVGVNATSSFNLPDLRGYFIRGLDVVQKVDMDERKLGSIQQDMFKEHTHEYVHLAAANPFGNGLNLDRNVIPTLDWVRNYPGNNVGLTGGEETRPKNMALNYILRVK